MGQQEIYDYLKNNRAVWFTSKELGANTGCSKGATNAALKKLRREDSGVEYRKSKEKKPNKCFFEYRVV